MRVRSLPLKGILAMLGENSLTRQSRLTKAGPSTPHDLFARETVMLRSGLQN
jgi:hypothetical protein